MLAAIEKIYNIDLTNEDNMSQERRLSIYKAYSLCQSFEQVAKNFYISIEKAKDIIKEIGKEKSAEYTLDKSNKEARDKAIVSRYKTLNAIDGENHYQEIANEFNVSYETVRNTVRRAK